MSTAREFHVLQNVRYNIGQVNSSIQDCSLNDESFGNYDNYINTYEAVQYADNRSTNTMIKILQHYSTEDHVEEDYQNEYFVNSHSPDQTIQSFDDNLNRQEHQKHYSESYNGAYAYDVDFNCQSLIIQQSDENKTIEQEKLPNNKIDVPDLNEPQGQYVDYNMSRNDFTSASQENDSLKSIEPIKNEVQKSKSPSTTVFPEGSHLYSESEIKRILSLPLIKKGKLVPMNLRKRVVYELLARNISMQKFADNVLRRSTNIFNDMSRSSEEWDKLRRTRREQYEKMKEWLEMTEDQKKAAVGQENKDEKSRNVLTAAQREALKCHFKKFPEARKRELVGLADQLRLPWKVVTKFFSRLRTNRKHQRDQQQ